MAGSEKLNVLSGGQCEAELTQTVHAHHSRLPRPVWVHVSIEYMTGGAHHRARPESLARATSLPDYTRSSRRHSHPMVCIGTMERCQLADLSSLLLLCIVRWF